MRACLLTGEYPPKRGGVADYTALLATALERQGVATAVVTSSNGAAGRPGPGGGEGPEVVGVPDWGYGGLRRALGLIRRLQPDVVHIQYQTGAYGMHPAINLLPLLLRLRVRRPRIAVTFHDLRAPYLFPKAGPARQLATTLLLAGADAAVVTNAEDAGRLARAAPRGPGDGERAGRLGPALYRVPIGSNIAPRPPPGYDRAAWRGRLGVAPDEVLLAFFGFLVPGKGVDLLAAALEELLASGARVRLAMVGGASADAGVPADRAYERAVRVRLGGPLARGRVLWTGFASAPEVSASLLAADLCVLPFREGASLRHGTLVAAIAHGLPILTTRAPAPAPLQPGLELRHGENCWLTPPGDVRALAAAVAELAASPPLRARLAEGARLLAGHFDWDEIAARTVRMYEQVTGAKPVPGKRPEGA